MRLDAVTELLYLIRNASLYIILGFYVARLITYLISKQESSRVTSLHHSCGGKRRINVFSNGINAKVNGTEQNRLEFEFGSPAPLLRN